ncbi:MAG TPA: mechanosensitive ion channel domain-containing protein [Candidatus Sulfotelmatobacter sp.]|nr:mechanosensitive ion channel domain-containing protein [Candidatus Sulfotelmatobacter sp.]
MNFLSTENLTALADHIWALVVGFVPHLVAAIVILAAAVFVARRAARAVSQVIGRISHVDPTLRFIAADFTRYGIIILALIAALEQVGVRTTSLIAVVGAAGLAIGLALQGTLTNIAAGLMLLWLRPFRIGDYVEVNNVPGLAGTIRQIGLFTCQLEAFDGLFLFVPNSALWNVPLRNYSRNTGRLISLAITIPQKLDVESARATLLALAAADARIAKTPAPLVFLERAATDVSVLNFRLWAAPQHTGALQRTLVDAVKRALADAAPDAGAVQVVRTVPPDTDPTRLLADDTDADESG